MLPIALLLLIARVLSLLIAHHFSIPFWVFIPFMIGSFVLLWFLKTPKKELGFLAFLLVFLVFDSLSSEPKNGVIKRISGEVTESIKRADTLVLRVENETQKAWLRFMNPKQEIVEGDHIYAGGLLIPVKQKNYFYSEGFTHTGKLSWVKITKKGDAGGVSGFFDRYFSNSEFSYLHAGFIVGKRSGVPKRVLDLFQENGVMHILAISGSHVAIIISFIMLLINFLPITPKPALLLVIAILWGYLHLLDYSPAPARAIVFTTILGFCRLLEIRVKLLDVLYLTGFAILLFNPKILYSLGFLLSFAATFGIIFCMPLFGVFTKNIKNKFLKISLDGFLVGVAAQLLIFPLLFGFFQKMNLFSLFLTLPLTVLFVPMLYWDLTGALVFLLFPSLGVLFLNASDWLNRAMLFLMEKSEPFKALEYSLAFPSIVVILIYLILLAGLVFVKKKLGVQDNMV